MLPKSTPAFFLNLLFACFPVLHLYSSNLGFAGASKMLLPLACLGLLSAFVYRALRVVCPNPQKASLIASSAFVLLFSYQALLSKISGLSLAGLGPLKLSLLILCIAFFALGILIMRSSKPEPLFKFALILGLFLNLSSGLKIVQYHILNKPQAVNPSQKSTASPQTLNSQQNRPNIYYFVLDGYSRADILQSKYQLNNQDFLNFLHNQGFTVFEQSFANYPQTIFSVTSTLNLDYIQSIAQKDGQDPAKLDAVYLNSKLNSNRLFETLKAKGYQTVSFRTGFPGTEMPSSDIRLGKKLNLFSDFFYNALLNLTPIPAVFSKLKLYSMADAHRANLLHILHNAGSLSKTVPSPFVAFIHLLCPHPPFVFDRHGNPLNPSEAYGFNDADAFLSAGGSVEEYNHGYAEQLIYLNQLLKETIEAIQASENRQSIIVLLADHGSGADLARQEHDMSKINILERAANLSAVFLPHKDLQAFAPSLSNVNIFRLILKKQFSEPLPLLADRHYFVPWDKPYQYYDQTHSIQKKSD